LQEQIKSNNISEELGIRNTKPVHIERNTSRLRELKGIKQEVLAMAIGVCQQTNSKTAKSA
jgi:DNA-binding XRE family transcriptional regulator